MFGIVNIIPVLHSNEGYTIGNQIVMELRDWLKVVYLLSLRRFQILKDRIPGQHSLWA
jgi:hypothetical protein